MCFGETRSIQEHAKICLSRRNSTPSLHLGVEFLRDKAIFACPHVLLFFTDTFTLEKRGLLEAIECDGQQLTPFVFVGFRIREK